MSPPAPRTSNPTALLFSALALGCAPSATKTDNPGAGRAGTGGTAGGAGAGGMAGSAPTGPAALPMAVTAQFPNQGWFADPSVAMHFASGSTVIRQMDGTAGPCASRQPNARGKCLEITYTPPPNLVPPPMGGWVGVFFLTTLANPHPELMPPASAGDANWGAEPGRAVAPGATRISFFGAAKQEGVPVTFKAGTDKDLFVLMEQTETLGTTWRPYYLPLPPSGYGSTVIGGFAWVLENTTQATTFYLDNIVWE